MAKIKELVSPKNGEAIVQKWVATVVASIKKSGGKIADVDVYQNTSDEWFVSIEHNLGGNPNVMNTKNISVQSMTYHIGEYMWSADVYIKPCTCFELKIEKS